MKFKPAYIYGIIAAAIVIVLFVVAPSEREDKTNTDLTNKQMPNDEIHKNPHQGMMGNMDGSEAAEEMKQKIESLKKDIEANPNDTLKIRECAELLFSTHNFDDALTYYQKILDKDKNRKDVYFTMAFIYGSQKNITKSEEITKQMFALFPDDPMVNYNMGAVEAIKGNKDKAREIWTKLIKDFPNDQTSDLAKKSIEKLK